MPVEPKRVPVPRWLVRTIWRTHRVVYSVTGGRGLRKPLPDRWGTLRLHTIGRRTGDERRAIVAYLDDGPDLVLMPMNGWAEPEPAWWLNLQAHPDVTVDLPDGSRAVSAHLADENERTRLWPMWVDAWKGELDPYAANRSRQTELVILEPRSEGGP